MKIAEVIPSLSFRAGAEVFFVNLCAELAKNKDIDIIIIVLYSGIDDKLSIIIENSHIPIYFCNKRKGFDFSCNKKFKQIISNFNPDVIHTHLGCLITYFGAFAFKRKNWKLFHTCHTLAKKESSFPNYVIKKIYVKKKILNFVAISEVVKISFCKLYKTNNVSVILNGVPAVKYARTNTHKEYDLIHVGRFIKLKNHDFLLRCISRLVEDNSAFKAVFVGDGELFNDIKNKIIYLGLENNIVLPGAVSDVSTYLEKARIFTLPSTYEGVPISILEAMQYGLPIIATNVGGIPELVTNNENGVLIDNLSVETFVDAFNCISDEVTYENMALNNIKKSSLFSMENCARNYYSLFIENGV